MNKKTWIIFGVICLALFGFLIAISRTPKADVSKIDPAKVQPANAASGNIADHVFGKADSKVVFIEYGDFQCPYCGQAYPNVKSISEGYKDKIAFVFRNFPLTSAHPNAKAAAAAAEAAGLQGKYWEMHNYLYENQSGWSSLSSNSRTDAFVSYAKTVGVKDLDKFKKDMTTSSVSSKISFDLTLAQKVGVSSTPTFYIGDKKLSEDQTASIVSGDGSKARSALDDALKQ